MSRSRDKTASLAGLLHDKAVAHQRDDSPISPLELFHEFAGNDLDIKGACTTGFNDNGMAVGVDVKFDLGDLFAPGLVSLQATVGGKVKLVTRSLLAIYRFPRAPASAVDVYRPVAFGQLRGKVKTFTVKAGVKAKVGLPDGLGTIVDAASAVAPETLALKVEVDAGLRAGVEGSFEVEQALLRTPQLDGYASAFDDALLLHFRRMLGPVPKARVKRDVAGWLWRNGFDLGRGKPKTAHLIAYLDGNKPYLESGPDGLLWWAHYRQQLQDIVDGDKNKLKAEVQSQLAFWTQEGTKNPDPTFKAWRAQNPTNRPFTIFKTWPRKIGGQDLLAAAGTYRAFLVEPPRKQAMQARRTALDRLTARLEQLVSRTDAAAVGTASPLPNLAFVRIFGRAVGGKASAKATLGASLSVGDADMGGKVGLSAGANGSRDTTRTRLQLWTPTSQGTALVMTQDTIINYSVVKLTAKAQVKVGKQTYGPQTKGGFNQLSYTSAVAFWEARDPGAGVDAPALTGTGLCFGASLRTEALLDLGKTPAADDPLLNTLALRLQVPVAALQAALKRAWFVERAPKKAFPTKCLLLESAWAAPRGTHVWLSKTPSDASEWTQATVSVGKHTQGGLIKRMIHEADLDTATWSDPRCQTPSGWVLQSITARYRMTDLRDDSKTLFKLGFSFIGGGKINLRRVDEAGVDSIVDVDTIWMDPALESLATGQPGASAESGPSTPSRSTRTSATRRTTAARASGATRARAAATADSAATPDPAKAYERAVPRVVLLHQ